LQIARAPAHRSRADNTARRAGSAWRRAWDYRSGAARRC
jgi:hypothetical protein